MQLERKRITVAPDSELGLLLKDAVASHESLLVDTGDVVYVVAVDTAAGDSPGDNAGALRRVPSPDEVARSQEGIRQSAGSWKDIDIADFKAYLAERRRSSSRPPVEL